MTNAYCTIEQIAADLNIAVTAANTEKLTRAAEAAAREIDGAIDSPDAPDYTQPWKPLWTSINIPRAGQHFKAMDMALGASGYDTTGILRSALPSFEPWAKLLLGDRQRFGIA